MCRSLIGYQSITLKLGMYVELATRQRGKVRVAEEVCLDRNNNNTYRSFCPGVPTLETDALLDKPEQNQKKKMQEMLHCMYGSELSSVGK